MSGFLLDTNILSEVTRPAPNSGVVALLGNAEYSFISVITLHELNYGVFCLPQGRRRSELQDRIDGLIAGFKSAILNIAGPEAIRAAILRAKLRDSGQTLHFADSLIAATAIEHGLSLVTRNVSDFDGTELHIINPWQNR